VPPSVPQNNHPLRNTMQPVIDQSYNHQMSPQQFVQSPSQNLINIMDDVPIHAAKGVQWSKAIPLLTLK